MEFLTLNPILCIGWIIVGAVAGGLARRITKAGGGSFINDLVLGLVGSAVGGVVANLLGFDKPEAGIDRVIVNLILAVVGAVLLIVIGRVITGRR